MYILELESIPREKSKLQAVINQARYERRINQIKIWLSCLLLVCALAIMSVGFARMQQATASTHQRSVYLPLVEMR